MKHETWNTKHETLTFSFCFSFNRRVDVSVMALGKLLYEIKGGGHGQAISKAEVQQAADAILQPLMDLLDGEIHHSNTIKGFFKETYWISENLYSLYFILIFCPRQPSNNVPD